MTVKELIGVLSTFPPGIPVLVQDGMDPSDWSEPHPEVQPDKSKYRGLGCPREGRYVTL
jgi:hypothetical protein